MAKKPKKVSSRFVWEEGDVIIRKEEDIVEEVRRKRKVVKKAIRDQVRHDG